MINKPKHTRFLYLTSITALSLLAVFGAVRVLASDPSGPITLSFARSKGEE